MRYIARGWCVVTTFKPKRAHINWQIIAYNVVGIETFALSVLAQAVKFQIYVEAKVTATAATTAKWYHEIGLHSI